jgi:glycosyltransferase involved in cell wall biosynthesis
VPAERGGPRAAVVIPCFDDGVYVGDAVASARDQEPAEIVVVDDGSSDPHTLEVLAGIERDGVQVVHQENAGLSAARMAGAAATSAGYVCVLDADDRMAPGALAALADALDGDPDASIAWGDIRSFGHRECLYPTAPFLDPWRITYLTESPGAMVAIRREALLSIGGWDMGSGYEDWDFFMKAAERGLKGVRVPMVATYYREHSDPRMYVESRERHDELIAMLRSRHPALFAARRANRRASATRRPVKVAWPLIDALPFVSGLDKEGLFIIARDAFEPWMVTDCAPSVGRRILRQLRRRVPRSSP